MMPLWSGIVVGLCLGALVAALIVMMVDINKRNKKDQEASSRVKRRWHCSICGEVIFTKKHETPPHWYCIAEGLGARWFCSERCRDHHKQLEFHEADARKQYHEKHSFKKQGEE